MQPDANGGWRVFDAGTPILIFEYSFGPGFSNALAVGGADGLVVFSPPCRVGGAVYEALAKYGPVTALVATNAFHTMGLAEWKARFPTAAVFAPAQAVARVERQSKVPGIRPISEAAPLLGPHLQVTDMPHYKTGEVLVRITCARGLVWYVTDVFFNMRELPANPVARLVFWAARSAPGLRFNTVAALFMMKDKRAVRRWISDQFRSAPPAWLIAAHGDVADFRTNPALARAFLDGA